MKFSYTALGPDNQKLTGELHAKNLEAARKQLHKMDLSIIALNESKENEEKEQSTVNLKESKKNQIHERQEIQTYYFEATDKEGKQVNGTIDAQEAFLAYKRLLTEFQFQVSNLHPSENENQTFVTQFNKWNQLLDQESPGLTVKTEAQVKNELEEEETPIAQEIVDEIDHFIQNTQKIIEEYQNQYSEIFLQEIQKKLDNLEQIRASNNLKHITKVCNDLYDLVSHPDKTIKAKGSEEKNQGYQQVIEKMKSSGFVQKTMGTLSLSHPQSQSTGLKKVKGILSKVQGRLSKDTSELERALSQKKIDEVPEDLNELLAHPFQPLVKRYFGYLKERNPILKRARKKEFDDLYEAWQAKKQKIKADQRKLKGKSEPHDFSGFFAELNSFIGWLLFFYLSYFFIASISLERNIGLPQDLVVRTLSNPLILNISIFLILMHLTIKLKLRLFRQNAIGSAFLLFLSIGLFSLIITNF